jgi:hypothetical protein
MSFPVSALESLGLPFSFQGVPGARGDAERFSLRSMVD